MIRFDLLSGNMVLLPDGPYTRYAQANALLQLKNEKIEALQHQLDQVTRERDHYKAACALADALRNKERGYENK